MPLYHITPQDLLFFRDSRPMESSIGSGGHGGRWPAPAPFFDAIHAALWRAFPNPEPWENRHRFGRSANRDPHREPSKRFGGLSTVGPFPVLDGQWLFPCPSDVTRVDSLVLDVLKPLVGDSGRCNLPASWLRPLASLSPPTKDTPAAWWNKAAVESYLLGNVPAVGLHSANELFDSEWTTGIGMDANTGKQDGERIYSAEYLRLRDGVRFGLHATLALPRSETEGMEWLFNGKGCIAVGGQQRICTVHSQPGMIPSDALPMGLQGTKITKPCLKWTMLSPAIWPRISDSTSRDQPRLDRQGKPIVAHHGGWLPNWICPTTGRVLLKRGDTKRHAGESRAAWRERVYSATAFSEKTRLIAARVPKYQVVTGWSDDLHIDPSDESKRAAGPKPTYLAAPAGSVYYFECSDADEAKALADQLNWHGKGAGNSVQNRRSTLMGEKSFGLGVCGIWEPLDLSVPATAA